MPIKSQQQRKAMWAAKEGRSTLGIPKSVGEKFIAGDSAQKHAAGVVHVTPAGEVLLLLRSPEEKNYGSHFGLPGGGAEDGESPQECALRECSEEIGDVADAGPLKMLDRVRTPNGLIFTTFARTVPAKFAPTLNDEHVGFVWASPDRLPKPLHPSVERTLGEHLGVAQDMKPEDWTALRDGFAKWTREEEAEPEHAQDRQFAADAREVLALDRASVREKDPDGRLKVSVSNISKAGVNPYLGREIPRWRELGLQADKVYQLLRHPEELQRAAPTSNGVPLLFEHYGKLSAMDHRPDLVVGSIGSSAEYVHPFLRNSLVPWAKKGIDAVESETQRELSSGYRYRADMTPGVYEGKRYDGVMRDIVLNHVAIVKDGRAGSDVIVGDSKREIAKMAKKIVLTRKGALALGMLTAFLQPVMAQDSKIDLSKGLSKITDKNFKAKRKTLAEYVIESVTPLLAQDADIEEVKEGLEQILATIETTPVEEAIEKEKAPAGDMETDPVDLDAGADVEDDDDGKVARIKAMLEKAGVDPAIIARIDEAVGEEEVVAAPGMDEPIPFKGMPKPGGKMVKDKSMAKDKDISDKLDNKVDKKDMEKAMDAAIAKTKADAKELRAAETACRPYVGDLIAMDSAEEVYRHTLKAMGMKDIDDVHASALPILLKSIPVPGSKKPVREQTMALDAKGLAAAAELFPGASNITVMG